MNCTNASLADDWMCTETGPVLDIHWWGSWKDDLKTDIEFIHVGIWNDDDAGDYSMPGDLLWEKDFFPNDPNEFIERLWDGDHDQCWWDPVTLQYLPNNHVQTWQYNLYIDPAEAFSQEMGEVYWLEIWVELPGGATEKIGWKNSWDNFRDDAVYQDSGWQELYDETGTVSLDLAFVITPEPTFITLLGLGALALLRRR